MLLQYKQAFLRDLSYLSWYLGTQDKALGAYIYQEHRRVLSQYLWVPVPVNIHPPSPNTQK